MQVVHSLYYVHVVSISVYSAHLKHCSSQVGHSHVLEVVLQSVHYGWHRHLERVLPVDHDGLVEMVRILCEAALLKIYDAQTRYHLEGLREDDSRGGDEHVPAEGTGVTHTNDENSILHCEHQKAGILQVVAF